MDWQGVYDWLSTAPLWLLATILFVAMCIAAIFGILQRRARDRAAPDRVASDQEGYVVSAVLGLLALLMGFTFSLAVDRFDARRALVRDEANAIGTAYLRTQLLPDPERTRLSDILVRYTDNRIVLAKAPPDRVGPLLARNDALLDDVWAAAAAGFDRIKGLDFSSSFIESVNEVIDLDTSRKAARTARVPPPVFTVLIIYLVTAAGVLGYVMNGPHGRRSSVFLLGLLTLSLILIIDIDRPNMGAITESQAPMEMLRSGLLSQPRAALDKWRTGEPAATAPAAGP